MTHPPLPVSTPPASPSTSTSPSARSLRALRDKRWLAALLLSALSALAGCAAQSSPSAGYAPAQASTPAYQQGGSGDAYAGPATAGMAPPPTATASPVPYEKKSEEAPGAERPGLATHWGETRQSQIRSTRFDRADESRPSAVAALFYNDQQGSRAMAAAEGYRAFDEGQVGLAQSGVTVSLRDERGRMLPGYQAGGKTFAIGEAGERYSIVLTNHTPARFEAVVTVDGLDVIDGQAGSFDKRGYLLNPHQSLEIEGFRRSESAVAAFRFGSVRGSYASRKGDDRNVGVIGVALFHERGVAMWPWDQAEIDRRRGADPFPGRFASPP